MKTRFSLLAGICILILPASVRSEAGWTDYVTIAELVPTARHYYEVKLPVRKNPSGCPDRTWFYQDYELKGSDKMFDALLEGLQAKYQVRLYVTGKCNVKGYSEFTAVSITP